MSASAQITDNGSALGGRLGSMSLTRQMSRQMSIYSLTLDEFQSALGEPAKNFGSMNMDDLLKNIWTAEETQAMAALFSNNDPASTSSLLPRQPSIQRQNSVTLLPLPQALSKKTVEEVWKDIAGGGGGGEPSSNGGAAAGGGGGGGGGGAGEFGEPNIQPMKPRQSTYGEMTLEDFLVKAGVMTADPVADPVSVVHPFSNNQHYAGGGGGGGGGAVVTAATSGYGNVDAAPSRMMNMILEQKQQNLQPILGAMTGLLPSSGKKEPIELNDPVLGIGLGPSNFSAGASSSNGYLTTYNNNQAAKQQAEWMDSQYKSAQQQQQQQQQLMQLQAAAGYMNGGGAGTSNGLGIGGMSGYGPGAIVTKEGSPGSPLSDAQGYGLSPNGNYGLDVPLRGRKRILDAPLEKIVERRQRRMIKNRESAARSRARKQAYTVELEAEVTQLKEENMRLRKMQVRVQEEENSKKKKQVLEVIAPMTRHLPKMLRRTVTGPW